MRKEEAFIFDLDGTLWDAREGIFASWREVMLQESGKDELDDAFLTSLLGMPMNEIALRIAPSGYDEKAKLEFGRKAFVHENEYLMEKPGILYPDVQKTLRKLKEAGKRLYIVSNCQLGYVEIFLHHYGEGLFDGYLTYGDTGREKSFTIAELMKREDIRDAVYVGDTLGDEKEAKKAGCYFVYASYGFGKCENPDATIGAFSELLNLD